MYKTVEMAKLFVKNHISPGDICIDATCGNGADTLFLSQSVGSCGKVLSFEIQGDILSKTSEYLAGETDCTNIRFINMSHVHMDEFAEAESISCIMFNLGWLPGGNHSIRTKTQTTLSALEKSLDLIKPGGIISICLYCGKEMGYDEKNAVLDFAENLGKAYDVIYIDYLNKLDPPTNLFIVKKAQAATLY